MQAFAAQDESDQAMAAYRTASRLFPGSHIPWLGIGMEYLRTNHLHLALQYIRQAREINPDEPLVLHEMGVLHYLNGEYDDAVSFFLKASWAWGMGMGMGMGMGTGMGMGMGMGIGMGMPHIWTG